MRPPARRKARLFIDLFARLEQPEWYWFRFLVSTTNSPFS
jgi:hypothetical protein